MRDDDDRMNPPIPPRDEDQAMEAALDTWRNEGGSVRPED